MCVSKIQDVLRQPLSVEAGRRLKQNFFNLPTFKNASFHLCFNVCFKNVCFNVCFKNVCFKNQDMVRLYPKQLGDD